MKLFKYNVNGYVISPIYTSRSPKSGMFPITLPQRNIYCVSYIYNHSVKDSNLYLVPESEAANI